MIKHLLLDVGGVIVFHNELKPLDLELVKSLIRKYGASLDMGHEKLQTLVDEYNNTKNTALTVKEYLDYIYDDITWNQELLDFCKTTTLTVSILSNNYHENVERLKPLFSFAQHQFYSCELDMAKTDEKIYKYVLQNLQALPEDVLFIDDKEENTRAAAKLGFKTITFKQDNKPIFALLEQSS